MINFSGGLIRLPQNSFENATYFNPDKIVSLCNDSESGTCLIELETGEIMENDDFTSDQFAKAMIDAQKSGKIIDIEV